MLGMIQTQWPPHTTWNWYEIVACCSCVESNEENSIGPIFSSLFDCYRINLHINVNYVEDPDKLNSILDKIKQLSLKRHKKEKESFEIQTKL